MLRRVPLLPSEASMRETWEAGRDLGALVAETAGTTRTALEDLEVTFIDVELTREDFST